MTGGELRFGVLILQDAPFDELASRWQRAERLGFDAAYVADHTSDYRDQAGYWLDGWTVLAHVAARTTQLRVGTLVSNPLLRHPMQLAKQVVAVDRLSGGRLELGIGTGIAGFDHEAVGEPYWSPKERVARYAEYVEIVDGALRAAATGDDFRFDGSFLRTAGPGTAPGPVQRPRPPITVAGQSPTVLRVAARFADCWNTHGPYDHTADQIAELTAAQNRRLDELCAEVGRDPASLRRSLLLYGPLDAWASGDAFERVVDQFRHSGMHEFVVFWPPPGRDAELDRVAGLIASWRG